MSSPIGVLEKEQQATDTPLTHVKRSAAKFLIARGLARPIRRNLIQLMVALTAGVKDTVGRLIRWHKSLDRGDLLPPLEYYPPYAYPLPLWLLRCYE